MDESKFYAVKTNDKCKCCGKKFGYLTSRHRIIVAEGNSVYFLKKFLDNKKSGELIEIDMKDLIKKEVQFVLFSDMIKEKT